MPWGLAWDVATDVVGLGLVFGVFFRLGRLTEAVTGLRERVGALEGWRDGFAPRPQH